MLRTTAKKKKKALKCFTGKVHPLNRTEEPEIDLHQNNLQAKESLFKNVLKQSKSNKKRKMSPDS